MTNYKLINSIFKFSKPFHVELVLVFLCIFINTSLDAINTWILGSVFDLFGKSGLLNQALWLVLLAAITHFVKMAVSTFQQRTEVKKLDVAVSNYLNHDSISKYFEFSNGQHINEHSGVKQTIITNGFTSIQSQLHMFIYQFFPSISWFLVSIFILTWVNIWIGLSYIVLAVAFILFMMKFNKVMQPKIREVRDIRNQTSRTISELYRYVFLIKNEVAEVKSINDLDDVQSKHQKAFSTTWLKGINWLNFIKGLSSLFRYATIAFGVYLLMNGQITASAVYLLFSWSNMFIMSLWNISDMQKQFITDKINIEKYFEVLEIKPDIEDVHGAKIIHTVDKIEFKDVKFKYPKRSKSHEEKLEEQNEWVLKGISFEIENGQKVAFVGESGSGKSTIANLVRRSFDPQSGEILINGISLKEIQLKGFLQIIGSVDQDVILFDKSLRENISFGLDRVLTDSELNELSKKSRIDAFYQKLEHGWDTIVGERGAKVSGGEKQRIGIARALAKNPEILIFDEATSALDTVSEQVVQKSMDEISKGKTAIIIAHRLSTVKNCDKIFVLKNGKILSHGTHDQLMIESEYYRELIKNQITETKQPVC